MKPILTENDDGDGGNGETSRSDGEKVVSACGLGAVRLMPLTDGGLANQPVWPLQSACLATPISLSGHSNQPVWPHQSACLVTPISLSGHCNQPVWPLQSACLATSISLSGHTNQPVWPHQSACLATDPIKPAQADQSTC
ncbi:hypothetical protein ACOMHN_062180 [Nucella lapillus]